MDEAWREIGRVRSVNPRAREVRVQIRAGFAHAFTDLAWIRFLAPPQGAVRCKVERIQSDGTVAVVVLGAGVSRDTVGGLKGARVVMAQDEVPPKPGVPWRVTDLLGMSVIAPGDVLLGIVCDVLEGPANDAIAVSRTDGSRFMLPVITAVLLAVDTENGIITTGDVAPFVVEA